MNPWLHLHRKLLWNSKNKINILLCLSFSGGRFRPRSRLKRRVSDRAETLKLNFFSLRAGNADSEAAAVPTDDQSISEPAAEADEATVPEATDAPPAETKQPPSGRREY